MPGLDYNDPANTGWMKNASTIAGIPVHEAGEISISDYYMAASGDLLEQRKRLTGLQIEIVSSVLIIYLFARNFIMASRMLISKSRTLPSWCCFSSSFFSVIMAMVYLLMPLARNLTCRITVWGMDVALGISILCNNLILLHKAYLVLMKRKWVLYVGVLLTLPQIAYPFILISHSFIRIESNLGCTMYYPSFILWYWVAINIPFNIVFSTIFCYVAYKQYQLYGSDLWKRLAREGIQTMCLALLCNITCALLIISQVKLINQDILFIMDW
ncbi:hypothetical protein BDF22DRAFT_56312 [Syncephalis plumigaleata]|nr:hypothetical protein BDF22DRAFT_56312 [Syncephalis plumigaleata]